MVLSNAGGTTPLTIGAGQIALRDNGDRLVLSSSRPLTFSGRPTISIPANAIVYSDPVELTAAPFADVAIDLYLPGTTNTPSPLTVHQTALQTNYVSETNNFVGKGRKPRRVPFSTELRKVLFRLASPQVRRDHEGKRDLR